MLPSASWTAFFITFLETTESISKVTLGVQSQFQFILSELCAVHFSSFLSPHLYQIMSL